jgi:hypothetical protein
MRIIGRNATGFALPRIVITVFHHDLVATWDDFVARAVKAITPPSP